MIKIVSWNIQAGGGNRISSLVQCIKKSKAHIIVLSEFRNNSNGIILRNRLLREGFRYQGVTAAKAQENSVLIAAQLPFSTQLHPQADLIYANNIITAQFSAFTLIGVYMPHKKKHHLFEYIHTLISSSSNPFLIVGDLNTGKNFVDQKGDSFWYTDQLNSLEEIQMIDAFRYLHGEVEEYSWYSHQGNGYRYDHTYVSETLTSLIKSCNYDHSWRINAISDHSPMFLELG
ncbi:MAG: hypothetical protein P1U56_04110 [Saprospiraceae bacterium]|nr:hypothetical protein [Saprospiraceae bacterium]